MPLRDYHPKKDHNVQICCICLKTDEHEPRRMYMAVKDPNFIICEDCAKK